MIRTVGLKYYTPAPTFQQVPIHWTGKHISTNQFCLVSLSTFWGHTGFYFIWSELVSNAIILTEFSQTADGDGNEISWLRVESVNITLQDLPRHYPIISSQSDQRMITREVLLPSQGSIQDLASKSADTDKLSRLAFSTNCQVRREFRVRNWEARQFVIISLGMAIINFVKWPFLLSSQLSQSYREEF